MIGYRYGPLDDLSGVPDWLVRLAGCTADLDVTTAHPGAAPVDGARSAAVLMLFGENVGGVGTGPDVLLLRRADTLDAHAGQVAFPGGATEPADSGPVDTALREAAEEVGVRADGVRPVAVLPTLHVAVSGFNVTPVLAHWHQPNAVRPLDPGETAAVARVPLHHLADPDNRIQVRHPSGRVSPAYLAPGMLIWGFTAALLTIMLPLGGWERPWDTADVRDLDQAWRAAEELGTRSVRRGARPGDSTHGNLPPARRR